MATERPAGGAGAGPLPADIDKGRAWEFALRNRDFYGSYQNHKETMAWLATAFYVGGVFALLLNDSWPKWHSHQRALILPVIVVATAFAISFVWWQFRQRVFAVTMVDASTSIAIRWALRVPSEVDLQPRTIDRVEWPAVLAQRFEEVRKTAGPRILIPQILTILAIVASGAAACAKVAIAPTGTEVVPVLEGRRSWDLAGFR